MPFTGQLGTADSQLGNIELASAGGGGGPTQQTIQLRANILGVPAQSLQLRANILGVNSQSLEMRANIAPPSKTIQMRANIRGAATLAMRARILQTVTADLDVTFDAVQPLDQWLMVRYNVGDKAPNYRSIEMRANILQTVTADLTVRYEVDYNGMPADCVSRPKTRIYLKTVRNLSMRAFIARP